jgi:hypothetical protein
VAWDASRRSPLIREFVAIALEKQPRPPT